MNLTIMSILKLNNARIFIHSIKSFRIIIIVFIVSDADMCTQFISIFLKNIDIYVKCNAFFFSVELFTLTNVTINDISFTIFV